MKKVKSKLSTLMQNFVAIGLLMLLTLLLCFTTNPFEKSQPKTIDAVSIIPDPVMYEWQQDDRGWYTYLGTYPQTYVGDELNTQLVALLNDGNLTPTSNTYMSNDYDFLEYENKTRQNQEYIYKGKLYVANKNQSLYESGAVESPYFSTGDSLGNRGDIQFFKVEPIKWYIIDGTNPETAPEGTQCRVISDLALNPFGFNETRSDGNVWRDSLIRQYLNNAFYNEIGLNDLECIVKQLNKNNVTGNYVDGDGPETEDHVYLLSYQEMNGQHEFLDTNEERKTTPTDFALSNGAYYISGGAMYWLRSAGSFDGGGCLLAYTGEPIHGADIVGVDGFTFCVRPALTLDLDSMPEPGEVEPIYISTADELKQLSDYSAAGGIFNPNWKFYLENDIDMSSVQNFAIGGRENPFVGYFNGQGHTISNIDNTLYTLSMFSYAQDCTVVNLKIDYGDVEKDSSAMITQFGGLIANCYGNVLISNVDISIGNLGGYAYILYCGGLIGAIALQNSSVTITDCNVNIGSIENAMYFGGVVGMLTYNENGILTISRCMVNVGTVGAFALGGEQYYGGVIGVGLKVYQADVGAVSIVLNQIYVNMAMVNIVEEDPYHIAGLFCASQLPITLTYNEIACSVNINYSSNAQVLVGYEWSDTLEEVEACSVFGTNSYFNFTGDITADFSGMGRYAGVFDVARKQYYSGFSDNEWLIFPTDKHPTIREFMAVGDFATVQSVEDKLIELGYTKIM